MHPAEIRRRLHDVIARHGDWTMHSIHLGGDIYTHNRPHEVYGNQITNNRAKLKRIVQVASDMVTKPLSECRVLDLGCLEGMFAVEFALHGSEVVAIEGREANLARAQFAKEVLGLNNLLFVLDDVTNLKRYGSFDVVLCLGILYHLNTPEVFAFVEDISRVCRRAAIIDTHFAVEGDVTHEYQGGRYQGIRYIEFPADATDEDRQQNNCASLNNDVSVWLTKPSLYRLLGDVGFSSVMTIELPGFSMHRHNRDMFVALKGEIRQVRTLPGEVTRPADS